MDGLPLRTDEAWCDGVTGSLTTAIVDSADLLVTPRGANTTRPPVASTGSCP